MRALKQEILVVEDDKYIRELLHQLLVNEGYKTAVASNGEEALRYLRREISEVKLILLDLMMPIKNGFEVSEEMQKDPVLCKLPIIIMSAAAQLAGAEKKIPSKAALQKPIDTDALLSAIRQWY